MLSKLKNLDFSLIIIPLLLSISGIALIYSLVFFDAENSLALKQLVFLLVAIVAFVFLSTTDYKIFYGSSWYLYLFVIGLLIYVDIFGTTTGGATRWIDFKFFRLQPSEFYKFVSIIFVSSFLSRRIGRVKMIDIIYMFMMLLPPLFLILIEPDLGTALVIIFSWFIMIVFSKLSLKQYLFITGSIVVVLTIFILSVNKISPFESILKDYQRNRVTTFINPSSDPFGKGYNVQQALIAVGTGGVFGRGLGHGSQSQLQFLPKAETDFIFSGFSEAFGLIGDLCLFAAFVFLLIRVIDISKIAKDNFGYLMSIGIGSTFLFQIIVNISMNLGLAPVTGIPLPFVSYGGSSLLTSFLLVALLQSIFIHRKKITF